MAIETALPMILSQVTGDSPRARRSDPVTSHAAADTVTSAAREASELEVLAILAAGRMTAEQVIKRHAYRASRGLAARKWTDSRLRTALSQLREKGLIEAAGFGLTETEHRATCWRLARSKRGADQ